jgi:hypothetical protein
VSKKLPGRMRYPGREVRNTKRYKEYCNTNRPMSVKGIWIIGD